ncbi:MAG: SBBP repeat-containing protein, partial [Ignavibacteria bacterium]
MKPLFCLLILLLFFTWQSDSFSQMPSLQFARRYNGPGANLSDVAHATAIDASGNIYVTGWSYRNYDVKSMDIVTIKYNSAGVQQWLVRYNGALDTTEFPCAIDVDPSGNVYVLGKSYTPSGAQIIVIKYNSAGVQQWVYAIPKYADARYSVRWLKVDNQGNVYGTSNCVQVSSHDYVTFKINSGGSLLWLATYDGANNADVPEALALDASGNVYVTGSSINANGNTDYLTIKYTSSGAVGWVARYNPFNQTDIAKDIAIDGYGYVYVTGRSATSLSNAADYATIKYNGVTGDSVWVRRYNLNYDEAYGLAIDGSNNIYVTGFSNSHITTIKYNSVGTQQWLVSYSGTGPWDYGTHIKTDAFGNVFVGGYTYAGSSPRNENYLLIKYNSSGVQQWAAVYDGPSNDRDELISMALDQNSNAVVTGFSYSGKLSGTTDYATIKYNSSGSLQWVQRYNAPVSSFDVLYDFCKDYAGNLVLTGQSDG